MQVLSFSPYLAANTPPIAAAPQPDAKAAPASGDAVVLSQAKEEPLALGRAAASTAKKVAKVAACGVGVVALGGAAVVYTVCFGLITPFVGGALGAIGGLSGGISGKAGDKNSVSNGQIGAHIHNKVAAKTGSKALAAVSGALCGAIGDGLYQAVDVPCIFVSDFATLFGGGMQKMANWLNKP